MVTLRMFPAGTVFLIGIGATIGKVGLITEPSSCNQQIIGIVTNHRMIGHYLAYHLQIYEEALPNIAVATTLPILDQVKTAYLPIVCPPLPEQERIAAYLDASCAAIDAAVAAKRGQLETLDALRKVAIKRAVMMGLNPSATLRRTDVVWIPEMPEHWRLARVKDVLEFYNTVRVPLSAAERGVMTEKIYDYYGASGAIDKVEAYLFDGTYILIAEDGANLLTRSKPLAFLASGSSG